MADVRVVAARDLQLRVVEDEKRAARHRKQRDRLIRELRAENPKHWTYPRLATAVGCTPDQVATAVRTAPTST